MNDKKNTSTNTTANNHNKTKPRLSSTDNNQVW